MTRRASPAPEIVAIVMVQRCRLRMSCWPPRVRRSAQALWSSIHPVPPPPEVSLIRAIFVAASLVLAGALPAQGCGSLAISGGASGSQLSISVAGASSGSYAILVVGEQAGSTQVPLPIGGSLVLGIAEPFFPGPIGMADMAGAVSLQLQIPANLPGQLSLQAQAVSLGYSLMPFAIRACASNVVPVTIG